MAAIITGVVRLLGFGSDGPIWWAASLFYTTQSNLLCFGWMAVLAVVTARAIIRDGPHGPCQPWPRLDAAITMAITVTMLIYLVVLVPQTFAQAGDYQPFTLTDDLIHIITPCLIIADWLLFTPRGRLRWFEPTLWAIIPFLYLAFAFTWSGLGGDFGDGRRYPYPFMNVAELGWGGVAAQLAILTVSLMAFGYLFVIVDKVMTRYAKRRPH